MAKSKVKKGKRKTAPKVLKFPSVWLENKIATARKFSKHRAARAAARFGAPAGVALLFFIFLYSLFLPKDKFQLAKERLVKNPNDFEARLILAEEYLINNQIEEAEEELVAVSSIQPSTGSKQQVLGLSSRLDELWLRWQEKKPEEVEKLITEWEDIISEKLDYRDGYLQLTLLHYRLYENEKAKEYLQKALELDPNFEPTRELEKFLQ